jgi:hypothetical protein
LLAEEIFGAASGDSIEGVEEMGRMKEIMPISSPDNHHKSTGSTKQMELNGGFISAKTTPFPSISKLKKRWTCWGDQKGTSIRFRVHFISGNGAFTSEEANPSKKKITIKKHNGCQ